MDNYEDKMNRLADALEDMEDYGDSDVHNLVLEAADAIRELLEIRETLINVSIDLGDMVRSLK